MVKFKCLTLHSGRDYAEYTGSTGKLYGFALDRFTEVTDPRDALFFLRVGNGKYFEPEGFYGKVLNEILKTLGLKEEYVEKIEEKPITKPPVKIWTEDDLYKMNKAQQIAILKERGYTGKIPNNEPDRIRLILSLGG